MYVNYPDEWKICLSSRMSVCMSIFNARGYVLFDFLENTGELNLDKLYTNLAGLSKRNIGRLPFPNGYDLTFPHSLG